MTQRKIALSIEEAADYTGIGRNTLRKLVEWKKLPVLKVGRKVLIKTDMLELFMEANEGRDLSHSEGAGKIKDRKKTEASCHCGRRKCQLLSADGGSGIDCDRNDRSKCNIILCVR